MAITKKTTRNAVEIMHKRYIKGDKKRLEYIEKEKSILLKRLKEREMAKRTDSAAKKRAWDRFSQWVRVKGCLETTGYPFVARCITCGKRFHIRALQAGHMIPGRKNGILFHENLTNPQCIICNERHHGRLKRYRKIMVEIHGEEQIADWEREARKPINNRDMDFAAIEAKYRKKTNELLIPYGYNNYEALLAGNY